MTENIVTLLGIVLLIIVKFSGKKNKTNYDKNIYSCHLGIMVVIMVVIMEVVIMVVVSSVTSTLLSGLFMSARSMKRTLGQRKRIQRQPSNNREALQYNLY